jgi:dTDP-4-amino-4,6-dideoxygalactose transaminase
MEIPFSPPSMSRLEIDLVEEVLRSGWITTGPKVKNFESKLSYYCHTEKALALNSATAGLELVLRLFEIGPGDEVITSPYTFAATANVILHCGATPVFADIRESDFQMDLKEMEKKITSRTKAIIPVDFGGLPSDYDAIMTLVKDKKSLFNPKGRYQESLGRILVLSDAAHSFGSMYHEKPVGSQADFTVFSFHAVKNLTTAEGGAVVFNDLPGLSSDAIYRELKLWSLHGQSKNAFEKQEKGNWFYTIEVPGYKYNMTDIQAALGIAQLERYPWILDQRKRVFEYYKRKLGEFSKLEIPQEKDRTRQTNYHLFALKIEQADERDGFIKRMGEKGIACNVHFIPLPIHPLYRKLGYRIEDYPAAFHAFEREISLPIYPELTENQLKYITKQISEIMSR